MSIQTDKIRNKTLALRQVGRLTDAVAKLQVAIEEAPTNFFEGGTWPLQNLREEIRIIRYNTQELAAWVEEDR